MGLEKQEIVSVVIDELSKRGLLKKADLKDKVKELLKNFKRLDVAIKHYQKDIKRLETSKDCMTGGPRFKSSSVSIDEVHGTVDNGSLDVIDSRINNLKQLILKIESFKELVNEIIADKLTSEEANLLRRVYFQKEDADDIAIELDCDKSTIYRRIAKSVEDIKIELFASDFIDSMQ